MLAFECLPQGAPGAQLRDQKPFQLGARFDAMIVARRKTRLQHEHVRRRVFSLILLSHAASIPQRDLLLVWRREDVDVRATIEADVGAFVTEIGHGGQRGEALIRIVKSSWAGPRRLRYTARQSSNDDDE